MNISVHISKDNTKNGQGELFLAQQSPLADLSAAVAPKAESDIKLSTAGNLNDITTMPSDRLELVFGSDLASYSISAKPDKLLNDLSETYTAIANDFREVALELTGRTLSPDLQVSASTNFTEYLDQNRLNFIQQVLNYDLFTRDKALTTALNTTDVGQPSRAVANRIKQLELQSLAA